MFSKPVSYDSLKCVLQHMEANKRVHVSRCCPSIWSAERATPLKIDSLDFERGKITINDKTYSISSYKNFHTGEIPEALKVENDRGGVVFAVDKFGIEDRADSAIVTPGDIEIGREFRNGRQEAGIFDTVEIFEEWIRLMEQATMYSEGINPDDYKREMLQPYRAMLIPLQYKRDNVPPPFENLIQLNVTSKRSTYIERCMHSKKYHEAVKQLGAVLFGERKKTVYAKNFRISASHFVIRLPVGVKLHIRNARFWRSVDMMCSLLSDIIHEASYPLEHLYVEEFQSEEVVHRIVRNSKKLTLSLPFDDPFQPLLALTNRSIKIRTLFSEHFSVGTLKLFVRNWIERGFPTVTHLAFEVNRVELCGYWIEELRREFNGVAGERSVIIPMGENSQLVVTHKENIYDESNRPDGTFEVLVNQI